MTQPNEEPSLQVFAPEGSIIPLSLFEEVAGQLVHTGRREERRQSSYEPFSQASFERSTVQTGRRQSSYEPSLQAFEDSTVQTERRQSSYEPSLPASFEDSAVQTGRRQSSYEPSLSAPVQEEATASVSSQSPVVSTPEAQAPQFQEESEDHTSKMVSCPVCYDPICHEHHVALRGCGHVFCRECVYTIMRQGGRSECPLCRTTIKGRKDFCPIYFQ